MLAGAGVAAAALLVAARLLNRAWSSAERAEAEQRATALRLQASLDSLSQGVAVFAADRTLVTSNACFHVLLGLPVAAVVPGATYAALAGLAAAGGTTLVLGAGRDSAAQSDAGGPGSNIIPLKTGR